MNTVYPIYFPHLGGFLSDTGLSIDPVAITVFGLPIYWYGIILTTGIVLGLVIAMYMAKKEKLDPDLILDFLLIDIVFAILGARLYFVAFRWPEYKDNLWSILDIRSGGIAIYGAIIASVLVAAIYTKVRKLNLWQFGDIAAYGLLVGQAIGRYGNFVNQEAFGGEAGPQALFAMQIAKSEAVAHSTSKTIEGFTTYARTIVDNVTGLERVVEYVQVHPTFFYESCWNIGLLILLLLYRRYKKNHGEVFFLYVMAYGIGRFWIEGLRTDQLVIESIGIPASQIVAIVSIVLGVAGFIWCRIKRKTV
ncbi:MAG: prolipoprotein diacylglyceryl transferase [Cellulosilyticaceae bacterium]